MASPSYLRVAKSETRNLADHDRARQRTDVESWNMSDSTFFTVFVAIAALLALIALVIR